MKFNRIDTDKVKVFHFQTKFDCLDDFKTLEDEMKKEDIDTNKVNILDISTSIEQSGEVESVEKSWGEGLFVSYNYIVFYVLEDN